MPYVAPAEIPDGVGEWFRSKQIEPTFNWFDVWRTEHETAFVIAKMAELDLLSDMRDAVADAIEQGVSLDDFVRDQTKRLQQMGWWGRRLRRDPKTGEMRDVLLGSPSRLRLIYSTNLRTSLAAGQWDRIDQSQDSHPFLLYQLGPSRIHRPVHVGWHGTLLPANDPWWQSHFPPNGWNCRCWIRQVSEVEAERKKWTVSERPADRYEIKTDPRTGLPVSMPTGLDPGWDISHRRGQRLDRLREALLAKARR